MIRLPEDPPLCLAPILPITVRAIKIERKPLPFCLGINLFSVQTEPRRASEELRKPVSSSTINGLY
ncbi:hypothetical protein HGRIS_001080 [Hohenbuehelia grisea]|uniref:Uncharacterized protein n=1 Tax=Hohenbuehelia grisea TaxID=104357 RepID=A0ABR3JQD1_9AGAR